MTKVLHVMYHMGRGGAETWLMHVLRNIDRDEYRMDFVVQTESKGTFDDEIRALGSEVFKCLGARRPWTFAANFLHILRQHGPYDIIHSHIHDYSGIVLLLARWAGVPHRIAHCHSDLSSVRKEASVLRTVYSTVARSLIRRYATNGFGCSGPASADLFGSNWAQDSRWQVLHCGIDVTPYQVPDSATNDSSELRRQLGLNDDDFVMGHVGRFVHSKNHAFLIALTAECVRREPRTRLVLVGDGGLRAAVEQAVAAKGLSDRVILTGVRSDVARLLTEVFDVFVMPSLHEGLPVALIEAQAAGVPCVISDAISKEAAAVIPLVRALSLRAPIDSWAEAVLSACTTPRPVTRKEALELITSSSFNIHNCVSKLKSAYGRRQ